MELCQEHGIAALTNFAIPSLENLDQQIITGIADGNGNHPHLHKLMIAIAAQNVDGYDKHPVQ